MTPDDTILAVRPATFRNRPGRFLLVCLAIAGGLFLGFGSLGFLGDEDGVVKDIVRWTGHGLTIVGLVILGKWWLESFTTLLTITETRAICARGILARKTLEMRHSDIRNTFVNQSLLQRIFKVGTVGLSSAGQQDIEIIVDGIADPERVVELVREYGNDEGGD